MSWSCEIKGKDGIDLMKKYDINYQFLGLAPNYQGATDAPFRLSDIRNMLNNMRFADKYPEIAQEAIKAVKTMLRDNLESLIENHCDTCKCEPIDPEGWDVKQIHRFLSIDLNEVYSCETSY